LEEVDPGRRVKFRGKIKPLSASVSRATEPNSEREHRPAGRKSASCVRNVAITRSAVYMTNILARAKRGGNPFCVPGREELEIATTKPLMPIATGDALLTCLPMLTNWQIKDVIPLAWAKVNMVSGLNV